MNTKDFLEFLAARKDEVTKEADTLIKEERKDESSFLKAKANIYDVFTSITQVAEKSAGEDIERFKKFFEEKADIIPANWRQSLENAKEHNDARKTLIEENKLAAVDEIIDKFRKTFGGDN